MGLNPARCLAFCLASGPAWACGAPPDVAQPPAPAQIRALLSGDWVAACAELRAALAAAYTPQACDSDAFAAWLDLQRWFDTIARNEFDETARLAARHLLWQPQERRIVVMPPGAAGAPTNGLEAFPNAMLQEVVRDPRFTETALPSIAPKGFRPANRRVGDGVGVERLLALMRDAELGRELFQNLREEDFLPAVVSHLAGLHEAGGARFPAFRNLAIALTIVLDQPAPPQWPHHQVRADAVPRIDRSPAQWFQFWIECQDAGRLYLDIGRMEVGQLKFVVDAPVHESELLWAQDHVKLYRYRFAEAFDQVRYLHERIKKQQFQWPGARYSLREIRAAGGICVDQAYFAMLAGKARGLPTLFFTGQGPEGGHAWFGFMKRDDTWLLDCGRERNRGHPVGSALDPQTWQPISDHQLEFLASGFRDKPPFRISCRHLAIATLFAQADDHPRQLAAARNAIACCPENAEAWEVVTRLLQSRLDRSRTPENLAALRAHAEAAISQFAAISDFRVAYQRILADLARAEGDRATADRITREIVNENRSQRSDLGIQAAWYRLKERLERGDIQAAYTEYRETMERFGRPAGGTLYFQLAVPFIQALVDRRKAALAEEALLIARKTLRPTPLGPLDTHMAKFLTQIRSPDRG